MGKLYASIQLRIGEMLQNAEQHVLPNITGIINMLSNSRTLSKDNINVLKKNLLECEEKLKKDPKGADMKEQLNEVKEKIDKALAGYNISTHLQEGKGLKDEEFANLFQETQDHIQQELKKKVGSELDENGNVQLRSNDMKVNFTHSMDGSDEKFYDDKAFKK